MEALTILFRSSWVDLDFSKMNKSVYLGQIIGKLFNLQGNNEVIATLLGFLKKYLDEIAYITHVYMIS